MRHNTFGIVLFKLDQKHDPIRRITLNRLGNSIKRGKGVIHNYVLKNYYISEKQPLKNRGGHFLNFLEKCQTVLERGKWTSLLVWETAKVPN